MDDPSSALSSQFSLSLSLDGQESQDNAGSSQPFSQASQATQPLSQPSSTEEGLDGLWGILKPLTTSMPRIEFPETMKICTIGTSSRNTHQIQSNRIGRQHCTIEWNGRYGDQALATIAVTSERGTFLFEERIPKGHTRVLRHGSSLISLGSPHPPSNAEDVASNDHRYLFRFTQMVRQPTKLLAKYDLESEIGQGTFGTVWRAVQHDGGHLRAIKVARPAELRRIGATNDIPIVEQVARQGLAMKREIEVMQKLPPHENVCQFIEYLEDYDGSICIVMELCDEGDLECYTLTRDGLADPVAIEFTKQLIAGLDHIHEAGIIHRDLKPANILLTQSSPKSKKPVLKIADFGLSKVIEASGVQTKCGTPAFLAPEIRDKAVKPYTKAADIWSLGMVVAFMFSPRRRLLDPDDETGRMDSFVLSFVPYPAKSFLEISLQKAPSRRASLLDLKYHFWLETAHPNLPIHRGTHTHYQPQRSDDSDPPGFKYSSRLYALKGMGASAYGTPQTGTAVNSEYADIQSDGSTSADTSKPATPTPEPLNLKRGRGQLSMSQSTDEFLYGKSAGALESGKGGPSPGSMAPPAPRAARTTRPAPKKLRKEEDMYVPDSEGEDGQGVCMAMDDAVPPAVRSRSVSRARGTEADEVIPASQPQPFGRRTLQNHN